MAKRGNPTKSEAAREGESVAYEKAEPKDKPSKMPMKKGMKMSKRSC